MLFLFYSLLNLTFFFISWYGSLAVKNRNRMYGIVQVSSKTVGTILNDLTLLYQVRTLKKVQPIPVDPSHPLSRRFKMVPSGHKYGPPTYRTNGFRNYIVPTVIGLLNNAL